MSVSFTNGVLLQVTQQNHFATDLGQVVVTRRSYAIHRLSHFDLEFYLKPIRFPVLTTLMAAALTACGGGSDAPKTTVAVIGDVPYGTSPTDNAQVLANPVFIAAINSDADVSTVLHVGDIHSGKSYCTEAYNRTVFDQWKAFKTPLVYSPGDNEWADCHKKTEGGGAYNTATKVIDYVLDAAGKAVDYASGDPVANLELVRSIFFASPGKTLGSGTLTVHTQAQEFDLAFPADKAYVENVWWQKANVLFVTLNIPGGSNNNTDIWYSAPTMSAAQADEVAKRTAANLRWLDAAFKQAAKDNMSGVVIQIQADLWYLDGNVPAHITQYKPFVDSIASNTKTFGKPVLLLNGDSHIYRSDNPLVTASACVTEISSGAAATACTDDVSSTQPYGYNVPNFRRVVVHGSTTPLEYRKLSIDAGANSVNGVNSFGPFSWKRVQPQ